MRVRLFNVIIGFLLIGFLSGCEDSDARRARYAEKKPAPRPLTKTYAPPLQDLPTPPKKKSPAWIMYQGEDMRQLTELSGRRVLIVFYAPWSQPSVDFTEAVKKYTEAQDGNAIAVFIDADKYPELARKYQVEAVPTTILYLEGMKLKEMTGAVSSQRLDRLIEETIRVK